MLVGFLVGLLDGEGVGLLDGEGVGAKVGGELQVWPFGSGVQISPSSQGLGSHKSGQSLTSAMALFKSGKGPICLLVSPC